MYFFRSVDAHVFVQPFSPPVPLLFCLVGAGAAIIVSFILIGFFSQNPMGFSNYPRVNLLRWKLFQLLNSTGVTFSVQFISVLIFTLLIVAGLFGNSDPLHNLAPTFVWVIWWVGVAYTSAFLGDIWSLVNPWKITFSWAENFWSQLNGGKRLSPMLQYSPNWGVWPGLVLFMVFAWVENVYSDSVMPSRISHLILIYSGITWIGMFLFGKETWLRCGETFSLAFGFLAKFAPIGRPATQLESKDGIPQNADFRLFGPRDSLERQGLNLRPLGAGLIDLEAVSISQMLFVLSLLATVTFDGLTGTLLWINIQSFLQEYLTSVTLLGTLGLASSILIFSAIYLFFCWLMSIFAGTNFSFLEFGRSFVYTLIPIALAYHLAHFLMFLLIQGQLIIPLASDPLGLGWDLLGTTGYRVNFGILSPDLYWFISVIAIVGGHIIAVFLSHNIALRLIADRRYALRSQYPMLTLMVVYTVASLWIITQPMYMSGM